jgi:hypothetical protein
MRPPSGSFTIKTPNTAALMPKLLLAAIMMLLLSGCVDGMGIGAACESEMQDVRRAHGAPDQRERGLRSEIWLYGRGPAGFYYEFSWGAAGDPCQVIGPLSQSRMEGREMILSAAAASAYAPREHRSNPRGGESR